MMSTVSSSEMSLMRAAQKPCCQNVAHEKRLLVGNTVGDAV